MGFSLKDLLADAIRVPVGITRSVRQLPSEIAGGVTGWGASEKAGVGRPMTRPVKNTIKQNWFPQGGALYKPSGRPMSAQQLQPAPRSMGDPMDIQGSYNLGYSRSPQLVKPIPYGNTANVPSSRPVLDMPSNYGQYLEELPLYKGR